MLIDLHTHSTASDGTLTPAELIRAAATAGLDVVALTDHDTTAGWAPAARLLTPAPASGDRWDAADRGFGDRDSGRSAAGGSASGGSASGGPASGGPASGGPASGGSASGDRRRAGTGPAELTLIRGAELSCRWYGATTGDGIPLHLLAYLFDPDDAALAAELARIRTARERRAERIVDLLRADGIDVTWAEVLSYANGRAASPGAASPGAAIGRPHIAQALIRRGLVTDTAEAFTPRWLGGRYRLPKDDIDVLTALRLVRAAGGVTVFAHPQATRRGRTVPDRAIVELAGAGLFGLEADHEDHSPRERAQVRALAAELGLVVTGSSDFHGTHKTVQLGAHTTDPDAYERIVAAARGVPPITGPAPA